MKGQIKVLFLVFMALTLSACGYLKPQRPLTVADLHNPLKTKKDIEIENFITRSTWQYVPQDDDCKDTKWHQSFYKNRYYKSEGDACSIPKALSVEAENWHIKNKILYMTNLSPTDAEDIVLKYSIVHLGKKKLVLQKGNFKYIFTAVNKR